MSAYTLHDMQRAIRAAADPALEPDLEFRKLFGGMAAYVHGRPFALLSSVGLALKLPAEAQADLLTAPGARPLQFEEGGVVFKQYVLAPDAWVGEPEQLRESVEVSVGYVMTLPAKPRKRG